MKKRSPSSSRQKASFKKQPPADKTNPENTDVPGFAYSVVKVHYHKLHSILPREAVLLEPVEGRLFDTYEKAADYCLTLTVGGEYSFVPMKVKKT